MGVIERYNENKKKKEGTSENPYAKLGVQQRYELNKALGITANESETVDSVQGSKGWQKYLDDVDKAKLKARQEEEDKTWWEKMLGYLAEGNTTDTTLPMATMNEAIEAMREDVSYARPQDDWTEEQQYAFGKLYMTDPEKAYQYAIETNNSNKALAEQEKIKEIKDSATDNFFAGAGHTIGAIATAPLGMADFLNDLAMANAGREISPDGQVSPFEYSQAVTGGISEHLNEKSGVINEKIPIIGGKGLGDVYGLGTSIAQSMASAYTLGPAGTLVSYFGQGAASGVDEALSRGATEEQALLYGTSLGVFEGLAEYIGVDNLFKLGSSSTAKGFIKNILKQAGAEGAEEGLTSLFSNIADNVIMQDKSNFNFLVAQYMAQGMSESEAEKKAWLESVEGIAYDTIAGAVSGGVSGGIHTTAQNIASNKDARKTYGDGADLVAEALDIDANNTYAQEMQAKLDKGKSLSGGQINRLVEINEQTLRTQDTAKMKAAAEARLTELGESGDLGALADVIVKAQSGGKLTAAERSALVNSKYGRRVSTELNPQSIESGEYTSKWAENIGTERINERAYNKALYDLASEQAGVTAAEKMTYTTKNLTKKETASQSKFKASEDGKTKLGDTEVSIKEIASVKNGEVELRLEDGSTVKASDITFGTNDEVVLYENVADMNVNAATANAFINGFDGSMPVSEYALGFREAYRYGEYGFPAREMSMDGFSSRLSDSQKSLAYDLGKTDSKYKIAEKQSQKAKIASTDTINADKNATKGTKKGKLHNTLKPTNETQRASLKTLGVIAETLGIDIYTFESPLVNGKRQGANGWFDPKDNSLHIDLFAGADGRGTMLFTAAHELTHFIREWSPAKFKVFADFLLEQYGEKGISVDELVSNQIEKAKNNGRDISYDTAYEEVVADSCEAMLADGEAVAKIAELKAKDQTLWQKIKDFLTKLVARIKAAYEGLSPDSVEGRYVAEMLESAEKLKALWTEALVDASDSYKSSERALFDNGIEVNSDTESASLFSVRYLLNSKQQQEVAEKLATRFGVTKQEAMGWISAETSLASLILNPKYSRFLDYVADASEEAVKSNSDYPQGTVDFSNICKKRRDFTEVMNRVLRNFPNHVFEATDLAKIRTIMSQEGMEVACGICYVEDRRQLDSIVAQDFIDSLAIHRQGGNIRPDGKPFNANQLKAFKLIEGDTYTPSIYELISLEGRNSLKAKNPAMEAAWVKFNNARGMQSVRLLLNDAEYKRQILNYSASVVQRKNDLGGLRIYSFSDMEMFHLIDIIQVITDSATVGLSLQGYTKVNEYAKAVKDTGEKLNRSLIPKGDLGYHIEDGKVVLDYDTVEGIDINHPDFFDNIDNPNVGNIVIGINATQIRAAMTSKFIDQIIPFHTGQSNEVLGEKGIATWSNYKDFQSERDLSTGKKSSHQINIYTEVIQAAEAEGKPITNKVEFVNKFLEVCKKNNLEPRFSEFLNVDENGDYVYTEGYHKFLVDFKTFDQNTGEYLPQMPVKPIFDNEYITQLLKDYVKTQKTKDAAFTKAIPKVLDRITKEIVQSESLKLSDRDSSYMDAVNRGDMETAQRMVDEAAREAGYTTIVYHGTPNTKTELNPNWEKAVISIHHSLVPNEKPLVPGSKDFYAFDYLLRYQFGKIKPELREKIPANMLRVARQGHTRNFTSFSAEHKGESTKTKDSRDGFFVTESAEFASSFRKTYEYDMILDEIRPTSVGDGALYKLYLRPDNTTEYRKTYLRGSKKSVVEIVVKNADQLKSADPVTYDDNGNVIPLSERFNPKNSDIRYSFRSSESGTANDALSPYNDELTRFIQQKGDYIVDSFAKLEEIVNLAFDNTSNKATAYFGIVNAETLEKIKNSIPNLPKAIEGILFKEGRDYSIATTLDAIRHIVDDKSLSREDVVDYLDRFADTILEFDSVAFNYYVKGEDKVPGLLFKKHYSDGTLVSFDLVSNKKRSIVLQTLYMDSADYQKKKSAETLLMQNAVSNTSKTQVGQTSANSIPQDEDSVKRKFSDRSSFAPTFYSYMGKVVDGIRLEKMGAGGVVSYLKGKGVKDEEIKWSGIESWLEGKKSVTKAELQEFLAGSQLVIEEEISDPVTKIDIRKVENGDYAYALYDESGNEVDRYYYDYAGELVSEKTGEEYLDVETIEEELRRDSDHTRWSQYKLEGGENYRELIFKMPNSSYSNRAMRGHWGQDAEGILVHARIQDFDVNGKKMLFIEELQSDWHNEGMEKGYSTKEYEDAVVTQDDLYNKYKKLDLAFHKYVRSNEFMTDPEDVRKKKYDWLRGKAETAYEKYLKSKTVVDSLKQEGAGDTPDAPFKNNYHEYVLKRLLRMAAEEGYDSIGWTPSWIQSERWSEDYAEAYRIEYDQEMPKFLRKYGKKWGATVGKAEVGVAEHTVNGEHYDAENIEVWSMDITDSMKESVLNEGQVMYSDRTIEPITEAEYKDIEKYFGTTGNFKVAGYLLTDGKLLDFSGKHWGDSTSRTRQVDHRDVQEVLGRGNNGIDDMVDMIGSGNIRLMPEIGGINLAVYPNEKQRKVLSVYINYMLNTEGQVVIDYDAVGGDTVYSREYGKTATSRQILTDIRNYFNGARQSDLMSFHTMYSDRNPDSVSNRSLLANALESVAQNDVERNKLKEYKSKIALIESEQAKLTEVREKIKELSFAKGPRDTETIKKLQFDANQSANRINTYDKQLLNLEATAALKGVLEREKKMAYKRAEQRGKDALAAYREKATKTQRELMTRYQESRKNSIEGRHKTEMRHKIKDVVNELNQYLLNGTKDKHVPIELQKAVAEALDAVNMDTVGAEERIAKKRAEMMSAKSPDVIEKLAKEIENIQEMGGNMEKKLSRLKTAYDEIVNSNDPLIANSHDEVISNSIAKVISEVGNTPLRNMTLSQLESVYDMYRMVLTSIRNTNKAFKAAKGEEISIIANRVMEEIDSLGSKKAYRTSASQFVSKFDWNNLKPIYAFERIGSSTFTEAFNNVRAGEDTWAVDITEAKEFSVDQRKKFKYDSWDFKKRYGFTSSSGKSFELSLDQIMSLYAYSKREQAKDHLKKGGIVFDETTEVTVKTKLGIPVKFNPTQATAYNLSDETLSDIIGKLTPEQKAFVDAMQDYLSTTMGDKGNEVSLELYGVRLYKEKNYFPLKSATQFMAKAKEQQNGEVKVKNSGFSKETVAKASNPIVLTPFMDVWASHVNEMSMYHAFVLPLEDFYRVYNYKTPTSDTMATESVEMYLQNAYGKAATQYIDQLLKDLNGGARVDPTTGVMSKLTGVFKKSAVFASASVVIQQPSAIARATALVDTKYFVGKPSGKHKDTWAEVKKYAPVAVIKEMGYFDTGMGRSTVEWIKDEKTWKDKVDDAASKAPALADEYAWCAIWNAVKRETLHTHKDLSPNSEDFLKAVGDRFTEVVTKTQVYDSVLSRSANMRSKDTGMKMVTAFMGEPTTSLNMLENAITQGKRGNKTYACKAVGSVVASMILNSILVSLVYAGRDDDEDKTYTEKYIGTLTEELRDSINPLTLIPFVKDIVSIARGYDVERSDMAVITDIFNAWNNLDSDNRSAYRKVEDFAGAIAAMVGLPVKNVMRDARGMYNTVNSFIRGEKTTGAGIGTAVTEAVTGKEKSDGQQLYEAMVSGDNTQIERVKGRFKDQKAINSAIRKALRENDPRIKEAAEAKNNGDIAEYMRIAKEIIAEGHFNQDDIVAAVNAEISALNKDDETTESTDTVDEVTSIYRASDVNTAFENGDNAMALTIIDDLVNVKTTNFLAKAKKEAEEEGKLINESEARKEAETKAKASVKSSMTSYWKPLYIKAYRENNSAEMARIRKIMSASQLYGKSSEILETCKKWLNE
jgi:hypothetical protein